MTALGVPMTPAPVRVRVSKGSNRRHIARCEGCGFVYVSTAKAQTEAEARSHRALHNGTRA